MIRPSFRTLLLAACCASGSATSEAQVSLAAASPADLAAGKRLFNSQCALCHGIEGAGGAGPSLQRASLQRASSDDELVRVVRYGIAGTEMPSFVIQLTEAMAVQVAAYVRSLSAVHAETVAGDAARGAAIYARRACAACHVVNGEGRALGPDLSVIGRLRGPSYLRQSIVDPAARVPEGHVTVQLTTRDGRVIRGVRLNEDVFWIHVRDAEGVLHSYRKQDLAAAERQAGQSVMPAYASLLSAAEIDDLVAYLSSLKGSR